MTPRMGLAARITLAMITVALVWGVLPTGAGATYGGRVGRIAFTDFKTGQIYAVNPDGSALRQLTHGGPGSFADSASWGPNGGRLIFAFTPTPETPARIWTVGAGGNNPHRLAADTKGFRDFDPSFGPTGQVIVFARCQPGDGVCAIWRMRGDGSDKGALTPYRSGTNETVDFNPSISPSGKQVVFARFHADGIQSRIFLMGPDGRHPHPITPARLEANAPDWAPSGRRIVFTSNSQRIGASIYTIRPDGTGLRRVTPDRYPHSAAGAVFSPRGNRLAFSDDRRYPHLCCLDLFSIGLDGTHERRVGSGFTNRGVINPAWGSAPLVRR
jgi:Tol biopolymer transport system component